MIVIVDDTKTNSTTLKFRIKKIFMEKDKGKKTDGNPKSKWDKIITCDNATDAISFITENKDTINLLILDGNLSEKAEAKQGPDIAKEVIDLGSEIPIASWTDDASMKTRFTQVMNQRTEQRYVCLEKPGDQENLKEAIKLLEDYKSYKNSLNEVSEHFDGP